jgi:acetyl-CoA carboxylase carboxyl transferase subunit alpha
VTPGRHHLEFERPLVELEDKLAQLHALDVANEPELAAEIEALDTELEELRRELYSNLSAWEKVQVSRHPDRPKTQDYVEALFTDVVELRGDRAFGDDEAVFAGLGTLDGRRVAVLGHRKGKTTAENIARHFGMAHPEGLRKASRVMRLAAKFGLPVVSFVDTPGAYAGVASEERGQAWAIAEGLATLAGLRVPVVAVGVGEGGSGGALAIGYGDRLIMLEHAYYSVSTPEACASILVSDKDRAADMAECLSLTPQELQGLGLVDEIVDEPPGGAHRDPQPVIDAVGAALTRALDDLAGADVAELVEARYGRIRDIGVFASGDEA